MEPYEKQQARLDKEQDAIAAHIQNADTLVSQAKALCERRTSMLARHGLTAEHLHERAMQNGVAALGAAARHAENHQARKDAHETKRKKHKKTRLTI